MALLLAKKLSSSCRSLQFATPHLLRLTVPPLLRLSTEATEPKNPSFITQYLISSFGFSPDRALKLSSTPQFSPIKTPDRPEAVVCFLKETGLTDSQIKKLITWSPQLLCYSVSNTLEPRLNKLVTGGFTGETLIRLIQICPRVLLSKMAVSRLQFWRDYLGNDVSLLVMIRSNLRLLQYDIDKVVIPIINLLKDYGFSDVGIRRLYIEVGRKFKSTDITMKCIKETEALGFNRESPMFLFGLMVVGKYNRDTIMRKLEFLRNIFQWSDDEMHYAFRRFPYLVCQSEKMLKSKIDFLVGSAGLSKQDISSKPELLGYSLERRLVPRHRVLSLLKLKDLKIRARLGGVVSLTESNFLNKYVRPYENVIPDLEEVYTASHQGKISS